MATKQLLNLPFLVCLSLLVSVAYGIRSATTQLSEAQQCRFQRLSSSQPSDRIESEAGVIEFWDENEEQFQCAGVAPVRKVIRPNGLALPSFHPSPRLVYIEKGSGVMGINIPGCAETFQSQEMQGGWEGQQGREQMQQAGQTRDQHQKVHRIRKGDILAIPAGAAHWCYNDGREELVAVAINDLNHQANQLDQRFREFFLAGGRRGGQQQGRHNFQNILRAFDSRLLSECYSVPEETIRKMQREDERGLIVNVQEGFSILRPDTGAEQYEEESGENGLEETMCTMKIRTNIDTRREADVFSRQAGKITIVNKHKLPILRYMDLSAEKGFLQPNALLSPLWSMNGHCIAYVTNGDAQVEVVDHHGQTVFNDRVNRGQMFVVPQFYGLTFRAGQQGFEWLGFKTTGTPMRSPLVGYTSVMRAMPNQVLTSSYQISPNEAQQLKMNRGGESLLLSSARSGGSY